MLSLWELKNPVCRWIDSDNAGLGPWGFGFACIKAVKRLSSRMRRAGIGECDGALCKGDAQRIAVVGGVCFRLTIPEIC